MKPPKLGIACAVGCVLVSSLAVRRLPALESLYRRGDINQDGTLDISDPSKLLNVLFSGGTAPDCVDAMDLNDDGVVDISDAVYGLAFLFSGGPAPPAPYPDCGVDASADALTCGSYPPCCIAESVAVVSVAASNTDGTAPIKGDALRLRLTLRNDAGHSGFVTVTPRIRSKRFTDFTEVPLGSLEVHLAAGEVKQVTVEGGPFLEDTARGKRYALGRGGYSVSSVRLTCASGVAATRLAFAGRDFNVGASNTVFTVVVYDQQYLNKIRYVAGPERYMEQAFTRLCEVFTPDAPGSTTGAYQSFPGGFDQMMDIQQLFRCFPGFAASSAAGGFCEQADAYARRVLGLTRDWDIGSAPTDPDHHGFDILVGLTQNFGGGATCGWLGTQVSGLFDFDLSLNRSQIIVVHEMGHIFGSPHCDPLQGYVMCAGEKHPHYVQRGIFVWHKVSRDAMQNVYD